MASANGMQIKSAAKGIVEALAKMTPKEREGIPTGAFVQNYNNLVAMAKSTCSHIDPRLWPKPIATFEELGMVKADTRYAELHAYAQQMVNLIGGP